MAAREYRRQLGSMPVLEFEKQLRILPLHCVQGQDDSAWRSANGGELAFCARRLCGSNGRVDRFAPPLRGCQSYFAANPGLRSLARTCPGLNSLAPTGPFRLLANHRQRKNRAWRIAAALRDARSGDWAFPGFHPGLFSMCPYGTRSPITGHAEFRAC